MYQVPVLLYFGLVSACTDGKCFNRPSCDGRAIFLIQLSSSQNCTGEFTRHNHGEILYTVLGPSNQVDEPMYSC